MVGARGFELSTPLLPKQALDLLTIILIRLAETLVACCVTKCQEAPIRLAQIWLSVSQVAPKKSCLIKILKSKRIKVLARRVH